MMAVAVAVILLSGRSLVAGLTALFILILGFAFCIPMIVKVLSGLLEPVAGQAGGTAGRLAVGGIARRLEPDRCCNRGPRGCCRSDNRRQRHGGQLPGIGQRLARQLAAIRRIRWCAGADRWSLLCWTSWSRCQESGLTAPAGGHGSNPNRGRTRVIAIQPAPDTPAGTVIRDGDPGAVWRAFEAESAVLVSDSYAWRHDVSAGSTVTLDARRGPVKLPVAAVYQSYDSNDGAVMMSRRTYDSLYDDDGIDSIGLYLEAGVDAEQLMERMRQSGEGRQALIMNSNDRIRELSLGIFDRTFVITNVLYWLAVGVAVIGILGAMLALQLERAKEFAVLRSPGHDASADRRAGDDPVRLYRPPGRSRVNPARSSYGVDSDRGDQQACFWLADRDGCRVRTAAFRRRARDRRRACSWCVSVLARGRPSTGPGDAGGVTV